MKIYLYIILGHIDSNKVIYEVVIDGARKEFFTNLDEAIGFIREIELRNITSILQKKSIENTGDYLMVSICGNLGALSGNSKKEKIHKVLRTLPKENISLKCIRDSPKSEGSPNSGGLEPGW